MHHYLSYMIWGIIAQHIIMNCTSAHQGLSKKPLTKSQISITLHSKVLGPIGSCFEKSSL